MKAAKSPRAVTVDADNLYAIGRMIEDQSLGVRQCLDEIRRMHARCMKDGEERDLSPTIFRALDRLHAIERNADAAISLMK
jgi:hypothetical protein